MTQGAGDELLDAMAEEDKEDKDNDSVGGNDIEPHEDEGSEDEDETKETTEGADDPDDQINEMERMEDAERQQLLDDMSVVRTVVSKLRNLSFAIINSTTLALPAWWRICQEQGLKRRLIPHDVVTRWNSTFHMLQFALKYHLAIDAIMADRMLKLRKYKFEQEDWSIMEDLAAVLEQYKNATLYFSSDSVSICAVIPAMDRIDSCLNAHSNHPLHTSILAAMTLAQRKLNRYYSLTDMSAVYRIAMGESLLRLLPTH